MGMFDDIKCKYPLPMDGANALNYQTKDTPAQYLDLYEIREDGTLWHEDYDIEDQSDSAKWEREHPGEESPKELDAFCGCMSKVNKRWEQIKLTGEICFYSMYGVKDGKLANVTTRAGWLEWSAYFVDGKLNQLHMLENRAPDAANDKLTQDARQ